MEFTGEHLAKIVETEQRCKSNTKRIDEISRKQEDLDNLTKSVCLMANEQEHMRKDITETKNDLKETKDDVKEIKNAVLSHKGEEKEVSEIKEEVEELKMKPAKRWDSVVAAVVSAIVGALIAYIAMKLGLK